MKRWRCTFESDGKTSDLKIEANGKDKALSCAKDKLSRKYKNKEWSIVSLVPILDQNDAEILKIKQGG